MGSTPITRPLSLALAFTIVIAAFFAGNPANADEHAAASEAVADVVLDAAPPVTNADSLIETRSGAFVAESSAGTVVLPESTSGEVSLSNSGVAFSLPGAGVEGQVVDGSVVYQTDTGSTDLVMEPTSTGVRALVKIDDRSAPTTFPYNVDVPDGGVLAKTDDGGAVVLGSDGTPLVTVPPPWAKDANGQPVRTKYEVVGDKLVQHVFHRSTATAYPVVADPFWIVVAGVAVYVVRAMVVNQITKAILQRMGYRCDPWGPWWLCYQRAS